MISLAINNSVCRIEGLSLKEFKELRHLLSYCVDAQASYFSGGFRSNRRFLLSKRGEFPTGLLYLVEKYLAQQKVAFSSKDNRNAPKRSIRPSKTLFKDLAIKPYPQQQNAVAACIEAYRGTVVMPTAFGKSITMALLVDKLQLKTLVIVPNLNLKDQLTRSFITYFGGLNNITIENIDSSSLPRLTDFDCLIIDEAHHSAASTYQKLNRKAWNNIYYRFFFTATPFRSNDGEQLKYEAIAGQVIYRITYAEAVADKRVCPVEAYYYELPKTEIVGNPNNWASVYSELVVNNEYRNELIAKIAKSLYEQDARALTLVKEINHGEKLKELTGLPFVNGQENNRDCIGMFNDGCLKGFIGTVGVVGEGVDTKPAEYIILAGGGKSKIQFMQNVGRGMRLYPDKETCKVILFKDPSHKWLVSHWKECVKHLRDEYGVVPVRLNLPID